MLKYTVQFQRQRKQQEEINKIVQEVSDIERKYALKFVIKKLSEKRILTKEESEILDEMLAKIQKKREEISEIVQEVSDIERKYALKFAIFKLSKKEELTKEESEILDEMLAKYRAEQNNLKPEFEPSTSLVPARLNQAIKQENRQEIVAKNNENIAKDKANLEPVKNPVPTISPATKQKKEEVSQHKQTAKQENIQPFFVIDIGDLNKDRLKSPKVNSVILNNNQAPSELEQILAKRNKISERNNNDTTEKEKVISSTTNVSPDEQSKLSERAAVEVQLEQKNADNIAASDQTQNSDEDSFLLQQLKSARDQLINNQTTGQEDNLPSWVKSEFIASAEEKKLEEKKEQDFFNFLEIVCDRTDLSEKERQELINFREQVCNVELRRGNEAEKKRFENAVSKIVEENRGPNSMIVKEGTRPNSIFDDEFNNNLKTIGDFIKENDTQQQPQNLPIQLFEPNTNHEPVIVKMTPKLTR